MPDINKARYSSRMGRIKKSYMAHKAMGRLDKYLPSIGKRMTQAIYEFARGQRFDFDDGNDHAHRYFCGKLAQYIHPDDACLGEYCLGDVKGDHIVVGFGHDDVDVQDNKVHLCGVWAIDRHGDLGFYVVKASNGIDPIVDVRDYIRSERMLSDESERALGVVSPELVTNPRSKKKPVSVIDTALKKRRPNPKEFEFASQKFRDFFEYDPKVVKRYRTYIPNTVTEVGPLIGVLYYSDKWGDVGIKYIHHINQNEPVLATYPHPSGEGEMMMILGGRVENKPEGIIDYKHAMDVDQRHDVVEIMDYEQFDPTDPDNYELGVVNVVGDVPEAYADRILGSDNYVGELEPEEFDVPEEDGPAYPFFGSYQASLAGAATPMEMMAAASNPDPARTVSDGEPPEAWVKETYRVVAGEGYDGVDEDAMELVHHIWWHFRTPREREAIRARGW